MFLMPLPKVRKQTLKLYIIGPSKSEEINKVRVNSQDDVSSVAQKFKVQPFVELVVPMLRTNV